jgi:hypothetical protein
LSRHNNIGHEERRHVVRYRLIVGMGKNQRGNP